MSKPAVINSLKMPGIGFWFGLPPLGYILAKLAVTTVILASIWVTKQDLGLGGLTGFGVLITIPACAAVLLLLYLLYAGNRGAMLLAILPVAMIYAVPVSNFIVQLRGYNEVYMSSSAGQKIAWLMIVGTLAVTICVYTYEFFRLNDLDAVKVRSTR